MEWLTRLNNALTYLEEHMEEPLNITEAAQVACSSPFHFQRMFMVLANVTVAEYVRKRKLTLAAQELAVSNQRVLDVALKYGYETPESFAKAFRKLHGISPSAAREPGRKLKAYPRLTFHISLKGEQEMDYTIISKEAFRVVGKSLRIPSENGENFRRIPKFWDECHQDGTCGKLCEVSEDQNFLGICMDFNKEMKEFSYMIAVKSEVNPPNGWVSAEIPASTWAVFTSVGPMPHAIQDVWQRIFQEWFPSTGYEHTGGPELEVYPPGKNNDPNYRCEIWIPVVKK